MNNNGKQRKNEKIEGKPIGNNRKQGNVRKMKEHQWKMKGKPVQTEKQKNTINKSKSK